MFDKNTVKRAQALKDEWERECGKGTAVGGNGECLTNSGIRLKPVNTPLDIKDAAFENIGLPGVYPYTRGPNPLGYRSNPWMMRCGFGFGTGKDTRKRWEFLKKIGMRLHVGQDDEHEQLSKHSLTMDLPTMRGYDPDFPESRGRVGECGVSISTIKDMELLFGGLPLDKLYTMFIIFDPQLVVNALYHVYAESRGYDTRKLYADNPNMLYHGWYWDSIAFPPKNALKLMVENIKYRIDHMPNGHYCALSGYNPGESGATPVQQVAFALATVVDIARECERAGIDPCILASHCYYQTHVGLEIFEEIAKIRAFRRMWAKVFKEKFGCDGAKVTMYVQTSGLALTSQEPLNNIVRATLTTLISVLGDVDGVWTSSYDEALSIPSEEAVQIAVRTQQIIYHETNVASVADPLGGSYYVEWLTNRIEEESWALFNKVEEMGGAFRCWEKGWLRSEIEKSANQWHNEIASGKRVIVGVNKYRLEEDAQKQKIEPFEVDTRAEEEAIRRVREFKARRDKRKVDEAVSRLKKETERFLKEWPKSCGSLMPVLIDTTRADATLGEMMGVLQEVCGYEYT